MQNVYMKEACFYHFSCYLCKWIMQENIRRLYELFLRYPAISTDSRNISKDSLFFALRGEHFDGNAFAEEALVKGAAYAIVDDPGLKKNKSFIQVDDVLQTLQQLATFHREQLTGVPVIAITGTNGKTTTKELAGAVLSGKFNLIHTEGNLNNHIGVPLTVLQITPETEMAVVEMGANHTGEIARLCEIARPEFGIITNIGKAHLEGFGGFEGVVKAKTELYDYINARHGTLFVNADNDLLLKLSENIVRVLYGQHKMAGCRGVLQSDDPFLNIDWLYQDKTIEIRSRLYGAYNFENIMAAICVAQHFGVPADDIVYAIQNFVPADSRSQLIRSSYNMIYLDAYNANPSSMEAAILNFDSMNVSQKMLILGDMFELGDESQDEHHRILRLIKKPGFQEIVLVGPEFMAAAGSTYKNSFTDWHEALHWLKKQHFRGRSILLKGSRGMELENLLEAL